MASLISIRIACYCPPLSYRTSTHSASYWICICATAVQTQRAHRPQSFNTLYLPYLLIMAFSLLYCFGNPHNSFLQWNYGFKRERVDTVWSSLLFFCGGWGKSKRAKNELQQFRSRTVVKVLTSGAVLLFSCLVWDQNRSDSVIDSLWSEVRIESLIIWL